MSLVPLPTAGTVPLNIERDKDGKADDWGRGGAGSSDSSSFSRSGAGDVGKRPHLRPPWPGQRRKVSGDLIRGCRTLDETKNDISARNLL